MNAVVLHLEIRDAAALALPRFQIEQERAAVLLNRTQLVELGVVAGRDDAAFAQNRGRLLANGTSEQVDDGFAAGEVGPELGEERARAALERRAEGGHLRECRAQARQVSRPRRPQGDACRDALDVGAGSEHGMDRGGRVRGKQRGNGAMPRPKCVAVAQRVVKRVPQPAAPHPCRTRVHAAKAASEPLRRESSRRSPGCGAWRDPCARTCRAARP